MNEQGSSGRKGTAAAPAPAGREADGPAGRFLAGVRAALADLPASELQEILDDVRSHLSDLAAELGDALDDRAVAARLGTPAGYAAELRAAAGYPSAPAATPAVTQGRTLAVLAVIGLVAVALLIPTGLALGSEAAMLLGLLGLLASLPALFTGGPRMSAVAELPVVRSLADHRPRPDGRAARFVADLQIAWWVVRALLAAVVISWIFVGSRLSAVVPLALVAVPASILLGRLSRRDRRLLWLVVPLNALAVVVAVLVMDRLVAQPSAEISPAYSSGLTQDGQEVRDIRPVDANGVPLTGVYLFDQDGRPIDTQGNRCDPSYGSDQGGGYYDAYGDPSTRVVQPYPRGTVEYGSSTGRCVVVPPGPLVVAVPTSTAAPTAAQPTSVAPGPVAPTPGVPPSGVPTSAAPPTG